VIDRVDANADPSRMSRKLLALIAIVLGLVTPSAAGAASLHAQHAQGHGRSFADGH
jgi:hypothetical protein